MRKIDSSDIDRFYFSSILFPIIRLKKKNFTLMINGTRIVIKFFCNETCIKCKYTTTQTNMIICITYNV